MILLDTNVISELMRPVPEEKVVAWFDAQSGVALYLSAITEAELWAGVLRMPQGKRRTDLQFRISQTITQDFAGRVIAFNSAAAIHYGTISAACKNIGRPLNTADGQIAATALANSLQLATRNTKDFSDCGVALINPWA